MIEFQENVNIDGPPEAWLTPKPVKKRLKHERKYQNIANSVGFISTSVSYIIFCCVFTYISSTSE